MPYRKIDIKEIYFGQKPLEPLKVTNCLYCRKEFKQEERTSKFCCRECYKNYIAENGSLERNHNYENLKQVTKEKIIELYNLGYSCTKASKELKISRNALQNLCKRFKLEFYI